MKKSIVVPVLLALAIAVSACAPAATPAPTPASTQVPTQAPAKVEQTAMPELKEEAKDIVDTAVAAGNFQTLAAALKAAGLVEALKGEGPFTVFAPTDEAFAALPAGTVEGLLKDPTALAEILKYHVVTGKILAADAAKLTEAETLQGAPIAISAEDGKVMINDAEVVSADVAASNGVIHVINKVILPPAEKSTGEGERAQDIVDTAVAAGNFRTLASALQAAGLVEALKGEGPFTVFAPTDEAFAKLPAGTVEALLKDPKALGDILKYHVASGKLMAADVLKHSGIETLLGKTAPIKLEGEKAYIGGAQIVTTDIQTSNGVIHVIDSVILPE